MRVAAKRWLTHASPGVIRRLVRLVRDPAHRGVVGLLVLGGSFLLLGDLLRVRARLAVFESLGIGRCGQQRDACQGDDGSSHCTPPDATRGMPFRRRSWSDLWSKIGRTRAAARRRRTPMGPAGGVEGGGLHRGMALAGYVLRLHRRGVAL